MTDLSESRFSAFIEHEMAGTWLLGASAIAAILWASLAPTTYDQLLNHSVVIISVPHSTISNTRDVVTNGLMVIFFLGIGLEIGRECRAGTLQRANDALAPLLGALGGMMGAALFYEIFTIVFGNAHSRHGWGIPMATDVAFTLGALKLGGRSVSPTLRSFLLSLAICDDIATVIVLALVAPHHNSAREALIGCGALLISVGLVVVARRSSSNIALLLATIVMWWAFAHFGIEPPLAGVVTGALMAVSSQAHEKASQAERYVVIASAWITLPLFTLCAMGIDLGSSTWRSAPVVLLGVLIARLLGKPLGVLGGIAVASRLGFGSALAAIAKRQLAGAAMLCAIGFTVPLIFAQALFGAASNAYAACQISLLAASLVATIIGVGLIVWRHPS